MVRAIRHIAAICVYDLPKDNHASSIEESYTKAEVAAVQSACEKSGGAWCPL